MTLFNAVFLYILIWWVMLFTVLPLGVEKHEDKGLGHDAGAPKVHGLKRKLALNSIISLVVLGVIYLLAETGIIDWQGLFKGGL